MTALPPHPSRKRLWELEHRFHCTIAGTCLTLNELRQLCIKSGFNIPIDISDYELHCSFVTMIGQSGTLAKRTQKYLDRKFQQAIRAFKPAEDEDSLAQLWVEALEQGNIAGPLWAAVIHPRTDEDLLFRLFGDVHMLSHLCGASMRIDLEHYSRLRQQVPGLKQQLEALRRDTQQRLQIKERQIQALRRQVETIGSMKKQLEISQRKINELESGDILARLHKSREQALKERESLSLKLQRTEIELREWQGRARIAQQNESKLRRELATAADERSNLEATLAHLLEKDTRATKELDLHGKEVLYIGGRHRLWPCFKALVEHHNGRFMGHDGGREDNRSQLDGLLARADLVLCPLDQVSHDAVHRLKRECKRRGKRFQLLSRASLSAFVRGLHELAVDEVSLCA